MNQRTPRILLAFSSFLLIVGAAMHASAFPKTLAAANASNLPFFFAAALKMLWLADSTTLCLVGIAFAWIAGSPSSATRPIVVLLALIPGATAVLIYLFLGTFFAAHLLLVVALMGIVAALWFSAGD